MATRIAFNAQDRRALGTQEAADIYNADKLKSDPAWVPYTLEQFLEFVVMEDYARQSKERKTAARAAKLAAATDAQLAQIDAIIP